MKRKIIWIGIIVMLTPLTSAWAADVFGTWIVRSFGMRGPVETIFHFEGTGARLTGSVTEFRNRFAISDGRMNGDEISFAVVHKLAGKEIKILYKGKVSLNEIQFTREIQGEKSAPQEFTAEREFLRHNDYIPRPRSIPGRPQFR
jgi:hypothetical protein